MFDCANDDDDTLTTSLKKARTDGILSSVLSPRGPIDDYRACDDFESSKTPQALPTEPV